MQHSHIQKRNAKKPSSDKKKNFVEKHSQTDVLVMSVSHRFDLGAHSCVNSEVKAFNRKLDKHMKSFQNAATVKVLSFKRSFYSTWSLNRKGKKQAAKIIVSSIKEIFKLQKEDHIYIAGRRNNRWSKLILEKPLRCSDISSKWS